MSFGPLGLTRGWRFARGTGVVQAYFPAPRPPLGWLPWQEPPDGPTGGARGGGGVPGYHNICTSK